MVRLLGTSTLPHKLVHAVIHTGGSEQALRDTVLGPLTAQDMQPQTFPALIQRPG